MVTVLSCLWDQTGLSCDLPSPRTQLSGSSSCNHTPNPAQHHRLHRVPSRRRRHSPRNTGASRGSRVRWKHPEPQGSPAAQQAAPPPPPRGPSLWMRTAHQPLSKLSWKDTGRRKHFQTDATQRGGGALSSKMSGPGNPQSRGRTIMAVPASPPPNDLAHSGDGGLVCARLWTHRALGQPCQQRRVHGRPPDPLSGRAPPGSAEGLLGPFPAPPASEVQTTGRGYSQEPRGTARRQDSQARATLVLIRDRSEATSLEESGTQTQALSAPTSQRRLHDPSHPGAPPLPPWPALLLGPRATTASKTQFRGSSPGQWGAPGKSNATQLSVSGSPARSVATNTEDLMILAGRANLVTANAAEESRPAAGTGRLSLHRDPSCGCVCDDSFGPRSRRSTRPDGLCLHWPQGDGGQSQHS